MPKIVTAQQILNILRLKEETFLSFEKIGEILEGLDRNTVADYYKAYIGQYRERMKLSNRLYNEIEDIKELEKQKEALIAENTRLRSVNDTLNSLNVIGMICRNCNGMSIVYVTNIDFIDRIVNNKNWVIKCYRCGINTGHMRIEEGIINKLSLENEELFRRLRQQV